MVDILVRQEDATKIDRMVERFKLITSNPAKIKTEIKREMADIEENNIGVQTKSKEDLEKDLNLKKPLQKEEPVPCCRVPDKMPRRYHNHPGDCGSYGN